MTTLIIMMIIRSKSPNCQRSPATNTLGRNWLVNIIVITTINNIIVIVIIIINTIVIVIIIIITVIVIAIIINNTVVIVIIVINAIVNVIVIVFKYNHQGEEETVQQ